MKEGGGRRVGEGGLGRRVGEGGWGKEGRGMRVGKECG